MPLSWYSYTLQSPAATPAPTVETIPKVHPIEAREKAFQLHKRGNTHAEVGALLQLPGGTIASWSKRYKWPARIKAENAGAPASVPPLAPPRKASGLTLAEKQTRYTEDMAEQALRLPEIVAAMSDKEYIAAADKITKQDATNRKALGLESSKPSVVVNVGLLAGTGVKRLSGTAARLLPDIDVLPLLQHTGADPAST